MYAICMQALYLVVRFIIGLREVIKKKLLKSGQADRLGGGGHPPHPDCFYFVKILTHFVLYKMAK